MTGGTPSNGDAQPTTEPAGSAGSGSEPVPRLPRGRGLRLSRPELLRVVGLAILLVFLVVTQRRCADAVSSFVTGFDHQGSGATALPRPGALDVPAAAAGSGEPAAGSGEPGAMPGSASSPGADPALDRYEHLRPGMTDAEIKAVIERARARAGSDGGDHR